MFWGCLGQGFLLTRIQLRDNERLVISGDDLGEFYYTFKVSSPRARRNALAVVYGAEDFREFACWGPALAGRCVVPALAALAMGDSLAVELAQASHLVLLQQEAGACRASELVVYRAPFPRGPSWESLAIDDHVGIQAVSPATPPSARRDREVFQKADTVYPAVGLCQHPKKKVREADNHTVAGGEIEGRIGTTYRRASAAYGRAHRSHPRASSRFVSGRVLPDSSPAWSASCWVHVFLYRRPLLSIFTEVFRIHSTVEAARSAPGGEAVFAFTPVVLNELLCACLLAPFASTNLRAKPAAWVYGTDASKSRAGIVRTPVNHAVSRELWRLSEFAGWHSRLPSPLRVYLDDFEQRSPAAAGARDEPANSSDSEVDLSSSSPEPGIAPPLSERVLWDCAEVFRGDGNWSECVIAAGLRVHDGFDTRFSAAHDLFCSIELFRLLVSLVLRKVVRIWHFGLPCVSWGTLRRPRVRSKCRPFGFAPSEPFTAQHNLIAIRVAFLMWLAHFNGQWASDKQPGGSVLHYLDISGSSARKSGPFLGGVTALSGPRSKSHTSGCTTSLGFSLCREVALAGVEGAASKWKALSLRSFSLCSKVCARAARRTSAAFLPAPASPSPPSPGR